MKKYIFIIFLCILSFNVYAGNYQLQLDVDYAISYQRQLKSSYSNNTYITVVRIYTNSNTYLVNVYQTDLSDPFNYSYWDSKYGNFGTYSGGSNLTAGSVSHGVLGNTISIYWSNNMYYFCFLDVDYTTGANWSSFSTNDNDYPSCIVLPQYSSSSSDPPCLNWLVVRENGNKYYYYTTNGACSGDATTTTSSTTSTTSTSTTVTSTSTTVTSTSTTVTSTSTTEISTSTTEILSTTTTTLVSNGNNVVVSDPGSVYIHDSAVENFTPDKSLPDEGQISTTEDLSWFDSIVSYVEGHPLVSTLKGYSVTYSNEESSFEYDYHDKTITVDLSCMEPWLDIMGYYLVIVCQIMAFVIIYWR